MSLLRMVTHKFHLVKCMHKMVFKNQRLLLEPLSDNEHKLKFYLTKPKPIV